MSSVASIGSNPSLLLAQVQQPVHGGWGGVDGTGIASRPTAARPTAPAANDQRQNTLAAALEAAGVDPSKLPELRQQIDAAVQQALQSQGAAGNRQQAVRQAVDAVLRQNGIDPAKFRSQLESTLAKSGVSGRHHHHGGKRTGGATSDNDGDDAKNAVSGTAATPSVSATTASAGVSATTGMFQDAMSLALSNLPAGVVIDQKA